MNTISCGIVKDLLPLYIDHICSDESKKSVEDHIECCDMCREELEGLKGDIYPTKEDRKANIAEGEKVMGFSKFLKSNQDSFFHKGVNFGLLVAIAVTVIGFYVLPLLIRDTGSGMFVLLILIPIISFISAFYSGLKAGIQWFYPILVALIFIPSIFIYYNSSATIYVIIYGAIALIGNVVGGAIYKRRS